MKYIILCALIVVSTFCYSQEMRKTMSTKQIGRITCKHDLKINLETKDTTVLVYLGFQNLEYTSITDIASIIFIPKLDSTALPMFIADLKAASEYIGTKTSVRWDKTYYSIYLYDFTNSLYLAERKKSGGGYTTLSKKEVTNLLLWLESLKL
jgi:hypothetical protein